MKDKIHMDIALLIELEPAKMSARADVDKLRPQTVHRSKKTGLRGFRPGPTLTGLCSHRRWLEA